MSFYSSLIVFSPGRFPEPKLGDLRTFYDSIRSMFEWHERLLQVNVNQTLSGITENFFASRSRRVNYIQNSQFLLFARREAFTLIPDKVYYAKTEDSKYDIIWDATYSGGIYEKDGWEINEWDYVQKGVSPHLIWPEKKDNTRIVRQARFEIGAAPENLGNEIIASSHDGNSYIIPIHLALSVGPVTPGALDDNLTANECYGNIELSFSGMGYFSWQPLHDYWNTVKHGKDFQRILDACRNALPAPAFFEPEVLRNRLGEFFLNYEEYRAGDWIVSVSEFG